MRRSIALTGLIVALAACGGGGGGGQGGNGLPSDPVALIASAGDRAKAAGTAAMKMTFTVSAQGREISFGGDGALDFVKNRGVFAFDFKAMFESLGITDAPKGVPSELRMTFAGTDVYIQTPPGSDVGRPYVKIDAQRFAEAGGSSGPLSSSNPADFFDALRGVTEGAKASGSATIDGVATTRYDAKLDLEKALEAAPESQREAMRASLQALGQSSLPVAVWVGTEDGLVYREEIRVDAAGANTVIRIDFSDYGQAVDVTVPKGSQVHELETAAEAQRFMQELFTPAGG